MPLSFCISLGNNSMKRNQDTHKYDYGHALLVAGAYGRMGCAILAARAALRAGCGLVTVHLPERCVNPMQAAFPEAMVSVDPGPTLFSTPPAQLERYAAIAVGPGLGTDGQTREALLSLLRRMPPQTPLVLDADALNLLSPFDGTVQLPPRCVITPHAGEYHRLFGDADPAEMARRHNIIIVKKAHRTRVVAPDGREYLNTTGNAAMATAGCGDVLTGIMLGIISQNTSELFESVCRAVNIHGEIGDFLVCQQSESSLIASDIVEGLKNFSI